MLFGERIKGSWLRREGGYVRDGGPLCACTRPPSACTVSFAVPSCPHAALSLLRVGGFVLDIGASTNSLGDGTFLAPRMKK